MSSTIKNRKIIKLLALVVLASPFFKAAFAFEFGPFTLRGFAKYEYSQRSNQCESCQKIPNEDRHRVWADDLGEGVPYGTTRGSSNLFQPYLGTKDFNLGGGFKTSALISQRWRDSKIDIPGIWYEKNVKLEHEDYGMLQYGAFPTRSWGIADFPYGTRIGLADAWGASGSGYGLLTKAIRYGTRYFDVNGGDLRFEYTFDGGDTGFNLYRPQFHEVYVQYVKGDLVVDMMAQDTRNGLPTAWTHGPFRGIVNNPSDEQALVNAGVPGNKQKLFLLMSRYQLNAKTELSGGIRQNYWSGAKAVATGKDAAGNDIWNNMFNYDWSAGKAYSATSVDFMLGARYKFDAKWTLSTGLVYLGEANTLNPKERGQSNDMMLNTLGLGYEIEPGLVAYGFAGMVNYKNQGLAPLSMPSHAAFSGVDSRVAKSGNWAGVGVVYTFQ
jgi:hypothetical protein